MLRYLRYLMIAALGSLILVGCADQPYSGDVYRGGEAQTPQAVLYGKIVSIRPVQIQADANGNLFGQVSGAVLGGLLGNQFGHGGGKAIATAVGAIGGTIAGDQAQNALSRTNGMEIQVKLDNGKTVAIVQKADNSFQTGQRVRLIGSSQNMRVAHL